MEAEQKVKIPVEVDKTLLECAVKMLHHGCTHKINGERVILKNEPKELMFIYEKLRKKYLEILDVGG